MDANLFAGFTFTNDSSSSTSTTNCSAPSTTYTAPVATSTTYKVPSAPPKQPFDRLILLQKVSGAFELTQDLADIVKQDLASLQSNNPHLPFLTVQNHVLNQDKKPPGQQPLPFANLKLHSKIALTNLNF